MKEEFNPTIVNMLIIFINKKLPKAYQNESNFINKFINLIKKLLLNEIELSCFTILIDEISTKDIILFTKLKTNKREKRFREIQ